MSFKTNHITDAFKNTFIRFRTREQSARAQELMFHMGFKWLSDDRMFRHYSGNGYLIVNDECRIGHRSYDPTWPPRGREIAFFELRQAADQVKAIRKAKRKDSRKRKAAARAQSTGLFIEWNGGTCPVAQGTVVDVKFRDGEVICGIPALEQGRSGVRSAIQRFWDKDDYQNDIVGYRLTHAEAPEVKSPGEGWIKNTGVKPEGRVIEVMFRNGETRGHASSFAIPYAAGPDYTVEFYRLAEGEATVSLADFTEAVITQDGWAEVQHVDKDGFIAWDGSTYQAYREFEKGAVMSGPVLKGTKIDVKYRNGKVELCSVAGNGSAAGAFWRKDDVENDIVAYRLCSTVTPAVERHGVNIPASTTGATLEAFDKAIGTLSVGVIAPAEGTARELVDKDGSVIPTPDTNPKKQYGLASIPLNLWSPLASAYGAISLYNGSLKYGRCNYMASPVEASIYIAAAMRHLNAWAEGEEFDPADGCPNLGGVLANIAIILEARAAGTLIDDRQMTGGYRAERDALKALVGSLQVVHAGKNPRHYTIADNKVA